MVRTSTRSRRSSPLNLDSAPELFKRSSKIVTHNGWIFGTLYGFQMLFLLNSWISNLDRLSGGYRWQYFFQNHNFGWVLPAFPPYSWGFFTTPGILSLILLAVSFVVFVLTLAAQLEASKHRRTPLDRLWRDTKADALEILKLVTVLTGAILIPSLLLIFAGHVLIGLAVLAVLALTISRTYMFAPYIIIEEKTNFKNAMAKSNKLANTNPCSMWSILFLSILIGLTGFIPFVGGLLSFSLAFLNAATPALRYEQLKRLSH